MTLITITQKSNVLPKSIWP